MLKVKKIPGFESWDFDCYAARRLIFLDFAAILLLVRRFFSWTGYFALSPLLFLFWDSRIHLVTASFGTRISMIIIFSSCQK